MYVYMYLYYTFVSFFIPFKFEFVKGLTHWLPITRHMACSGKLTASAYSLSYEALTQIFSCIFMLLHS